MEASTYRPLEPEVKALWLQALLSGAYPQTRLTLRRKQDSGSSHPEGYCCLGVLCDISGLGRWDESGYNRIPFVVGDGPREESHTPTEVKEWSGLEVYASSRLAELNDSGASFTAIAKWIDENL